MRVFTTSMSGQIYKGYRGSEMSHFNWTVPLKLRLQSLEISCSSEMMCSLHNWLLFYRQVMEKKLNYCLLITILNIYFFYIFLNLQLDIDFLLRTNNSLMILHFVLDILYLYYKMYLLRFTTDIVYTFKSCCSL